MRGSAGFLGAYNPRTGGAGYVAGGRNVYGAWKSAGVRRGSEWARATARDTAGGGSALRWNTSNGQGFVREGRRGDIYAGRDGNVYRNAGDGWQRFDGGWQDIAQPKGSELLGRGEGREGLSPEGRERLQERGQGAGVRELAGAGAAGAAGAALGQRLGNATTRERAQDRAVQGPTGDRQAQQRPAAQQRSTPQSPAQKDRPAAQQRSPTTARPAPPRTTTQRPAISQQLPSNLPRDFDARSLGNQRQIANSQLYRSPSQFSGSPQRSFAPRGGGYSGGGSFRGGGGGRGGGRR